MDWLLYIIAVGNIVLLVVLILMVAGYGGKTRELRINVAMIEKYLDRLEKIIKSEAIDSRKNIDFNSRALREEIMNAFNRFADSVLGRINENNTTQLNQLNSFSGHLRALTGSNEQRLEQLRETVEKQLAAMREDNGVRLEKMRQIVDVKLQETLEKRLGESFKLVSERLEMVQRGLGEMQALASGVGDLKRILTNVKTRGIWGEISLGSLLEQILSPEQYEKNVATIPNSNERVEYAIKLPGKDQGDGVVWLPIDAKFPQEDYQRLLDAQDRADQPAADEAAKALAIRIKAEAKDIVVKYVAAPYTTEFAIMFLPIEGLYAEVLRQPGLCEQLMKNYKVIITGPTTLAALLNSLQMGFRTLAIEKRSSEVWSLLGAVKTEFGRFGDLLDKTHKKLEEASNSIDIAARKSRNIERKLRKVQELPAEEAEQVLEAGE